VTNKSTPVMLARRSYSGMGYVHQGWLTADQRYFLEDDEFDEVNAQHNTRTYVWDLADLTAPQWLGYHEGTTPAIDHNQVTRLYAHGEYVFQANYRAGLRVLRLNDLGQVGLQEVAFFDVYPGDDARGFSGAWGTYPFFPSGTVIVSSIEGGLFVVAPQFEAAGATPAPTPTATPTVEQSYTVSGRVRYHASHVPVPGTMLYLQGPAPGMVQTDQNGSFALNGLRGGDSWEVQARKNGDMATAITAMDAVFALQSVLALRTLDAQQQLACDVSGDGRVSPIDAVMMLQYKVGLLDQFPVSTACESDWAFTPAPATVPNQQLVQPQSGATSCQRGAIDFTPLDGTAEGQDFSAVLFGDCSLNWQPGIGSTAPGRLPGGEPRSQHHRVRLGRLPSTRTGTVRVPVYIDGDRPLHGLDLQLAYDAARLRFAGARRVRQTRSAAMALNSPRPGVLALSMASINPLRRGPVVVLQFAGRTTATTLPQVISANTE